MTALAVEQGATVRVEIPLAGFINAVKAVSLAAGTDHSLPVLTGMAVTLFNDGVRLVSTDRYRLAVAGSGTGSELGSTLVSAKDLTAFIKSLKIPARTYQAPTAVLEITDGYLFSVSALDSARTFIPLDGTFPPYAHLIESARTNPMGDLTAFRFACGYLSDGMDAVALMAGDSRRTDRAARFTMRAADKPALIEPEVPLEGWSFTYLLMPRRAAS